MQAHSRLLPLLRSQLLGELLAWISLHPEVSYSVTELAQRLGVSASTVSREADRLVEATLVREVRRGNLRLLQFESGNPLARALTELMALTYGPAAVLAELLPAVDGVAEAYIYGSWAARYAGEPGPPPRDVDVLVVGDADDDDLADAATRAERLLGREVNVHRVSSAVWHSTAEDPFLASVRNRPLHAVLGPGADHEVAAGSRDHRRDDHARRAGTGAGEP